jgi:bifunctional DNase/RNase
MSQLENPSYVQLKVHGVLPDPNTETQIVLLREDQQEEILPIWVGAAEGHAIDLALKEVTPPRPMTHDLIYNCTKHFHTTISKVLVTDVKESTYYASVVLHNRETERTVDARPSDAIALALRANAPIFATQEVLSRRGAGNLQTWLEKFDSKDSKPLDSEHL